MLSYTGVTIGAILGLGLIAAVVANFWLDNQLKNTDLPYQLVEKAAAGYVNELRPMLNQSPPDQENIGSLLERIETTPTLILLENLPITIDPEDLQVLIVDRQGILMGQPSIPNFENNVVNEFFDAQEFPQLSEALHTALTGQGGPPGWQRTTLADNIVIAAPVWDLAEEQVLGGLVLSFTVPSATSLVAEFAADIVLDLFVIMLLAGVIGTFFGLLLGRDITNRLDQLADATFAWSQGDFSVYVDDSSGDELGQLAERLNNMARQLQNLLETHSQLLVVEERNRLARDLHDSAKQQAFAAAAQISAARKLFPQNPDAAQTSIIEAERLINDLRKELTSLIEELRPAALEDMGLVPAIRTYAEDWSRQNGIELAVTAQHERQLPLDVEQMVFRIVQEALANISRHSQAASASIRLSYNKHEITCSISDNGIGFDIKKKSSGFGIRSMQERANSLGGAVTIESMPDHGTHISFTVPLENPRKTRRAIHE